MKSDWFGWSTCLSLYRAVKTNAADDRAHSVAKPWLPQCLHLLVHWDLCGKKKSAAHRSAPRLINRAQRGAGVGATMLQLHSSVMTPRVGAE